MICGTIHLNKRTYLKEEYEDAKKIRNVKKISLLCSKNVAIRENYLLVTSL